MLICFVVYYHILVWSLLENRLACHVLVFMFVLGSVLYKLGKVNIFVTYLFIKDHLCGQVVRFSGYRYRGLGFDSRRYQIF